ncbi:MAG: serine/threonine protein kinase [Akkermansia sp.]|nr:serine/threonine protein kinase [Akkermansia sp.]
MDISEQGFMAEIMCPGCGMVNTVHTVLHNFRLERVLGVGGMSIVLQARDLVLNRTLAIKLLKDSYRSDPERVARFEKECSLMAKVRHPNVVSVYSAGAANGQFYIAMELVEGTNLEHMVSPSAPMEPLKALSIVRQVAKGLSAANKAGLLHRDIKPGNVLVTRTGRAKVLDFGLSLGKADADTEETIWATPFYVPPETLLRETEDVRTDIYALGMTLRFLLSGCETFTNIPQTPDELLACKRQLQPVRHRDYRIDEAYADLINHMTAYDINSRPTGYVDLLQELEEVYEAQRLYEVEHSPAGRARHRIRRVIYCTCVLVLGLLTMWLTSIVCTPAQEYDAIVFAALDKTLQNDTHLLNEAESALKNQQWDESASKFMLLANNAEDPAMGAWGGLVSVYLAELGGGGVKAEDAMKIFTNRLSSDTSTSPAGKEGMNKMRTIWHAIRNDKAALPQRNEAGEEVWKAFLHFSKLCYYAHKDNKIEMQVQQEKVIEFFELSNSPYSQLALVLKKWDDASALKTQLSQKKETETLPDSQETSDQYYTISSVDSADEMSSAPSSAIPDYVSLDTEDSSLYGKRRKQIVAEMKKVSDGVDAMLKRKFNAQYRESMSREDKMELIRKIGNARIEQEVQTLYHLLSGRIDDAVQSNPYRYYPDSLEPFSVLVKRWILSTAQKKTAPFPHERISIVTPNGIAQANLQQANRLTGAAEGAIVAHSDYGMTLEKDNGADKTQLVDYLRISHDTYCEMPAESEQGVWIDVSESSWRSPCFLKGETFVRPLSSVKADTATILQRDENSVSIRWNQSGETARYKRCAKGIYLREDEKNAHLHPLVNQDGTTLVLVNKMKSAKIVRESAQKSHTLKHLEITSKTITLTRRDSDLQEKYELADDGIYYGNSSANNHSQPPPAKYPLTSIDWMFPKDASARNVRINQAERTLIAEVSIKKRVADVLYVKENELCVKWKDTNERETFRRMPCGGFVTTNFPVGTKLISIVDYGGRATYADIPGSSGILLSVFQYIKDIKTLEVNNKRLRLRGRHGEEITYINDGKGVYVREDSPDGASCVRMFESPGKWRGYVGIQRKTATLLLSSGICEQCDLIEKTDDSYTLSWRIKEKTQETFRKKPDTDVYVLEPRQKTDLSFSNTRIWYADAFTQVEADLDANNAPQLRISPKYGTFKADVVHFDKNKMVLNWEDAFFEKNRGLALNDGSRIDVSEKRRMNITYTRRPDNCYTIDSVEFTDGAECEVITLHSRMWVGPLTIHKGRNKAWRMTPQGKCESADVLSFDANKLVLKWHGWKETSYTRDSAGVYRQDPGTNGETTLIHWGNKSMFLYIEGKEARICDTPHTLAKIGTILEKSSTSMRIRWMLTGVEETFTKDSKGEYHKKQ